MKPRMSDRIEQLERTLRIVNEAKKEQDHQIAILQTQLRAAERLARWGEQLLDGMCMGMKEGSLPRRTHL